MEQAAGAARRDVLRRSIGGLRIGKPQVTIQHREDLRGEIPALALQVPGALAAIADLRRCPGVEQDHRLRPHPAVLDEAEGEAVDRPRSRPRRLGRRSAEKGRRIGKARPVHVEPELAAPGETAERREFIGAVGAPVFRSWGDRDGVGLHLVHVVADRVDQGGDALRLSFAPSPSASISFAP